ncbi:MAG: hypothetical protein PWR27_2082 [Petroclostridium sp.]|jgi:hypothetical protein|uniref:hypothetical protein n=1 Tax=Petroclostridium xylanilyticum TaxID=1792311 RepID=UPI000B988C74|nr:hypothetical protein [Petroclostridium xylanilyticum]MBZ4647107.1 hypothetical protein [Clostridia bacterium]MDK2811373.1 hypothetical protein [Petroclostridium sp.]
MNYGYYQNYIQQYYPGMMDYEPMRYPDIYYVIHPMVRRKCEMMDTPYNPMMQPYPSYEMVEQMTDEIVEELRMSHPDMMRDYGIQSESETEQFFGPRGLLRALIAILLIRELLRRRGTYGYPGYGYGYYGPGYGYSPYGGYMGY